MRLLTIRCIINVASGASWLCCVNWGDVVKNQYYPRYDGLFGAGVVA